MYKVVYVVRFYYLLLFSSSAVIVFTCCPVKSAFSLTCVRGGGGGGESSLFPVSLNGRQVGVDNTSASFSEKRSKHYCGVCIAKK